MCNTTGSYPTLLVDTTANNVVSQNGTVLLVATARKIGLDRDLTAALARWKSQWATIDPGETSPALD